MEKLEKIESVYREVNNLFLNLYIHDMVNKRPRDFIKEIMWDRLKGIVNKIICDETNNPPEIVDQGIVMCRIIFNLKMKKDLSCDYTLINLPFIDLTFGSVDIEETIKQIENKYNMKKQKFTKDDLETGMLVQYRRGDVALIIDDKIISKNSYMPLKSYNQNLLLKKEYPGNNDDLDIIRVSKKLNTPIPKNWNEEKLLEDLLWEREKKETIKIGGRKYYKDDIESALKDVKPIDQ